MGHPQVTVAFKSLVYLQPKDPARTDEPLRVLCAGGRHQWAHWPWLQVREGGWARRWTTAPDFHLETQWPYPIGQRHPIFGV